MSSFTFNTIALFFGLYIFVITVYYFVRLSLNFKRRESSLRYMERFSNDHDYQHALKIMQHSDDEGEIDLLRISESPDEYFAIVKFLNYFEFIAIGIRANVVDERMLRQAFESVLSGTFNRLRPLINQERSKSGQPAVWEQLESLASKWSATD